MKALILFFILISFVATAQNKVIFHDDFTSQPKVSNTMWHIPTWTGPSDGTYFGRTQVRCSQNSPLPSTSIGSALVNLDTHNPTGFSIYGTDLITNRTFLPGNGLIFTIRAKMQSPIIGGIVGGIFLYNNRVLPNHDEIDFELLTNQLNFVHTNVYSNEPLGVGHPDSVTVSPNITEWHTYVMKWKKDSVIWFVDGKLAKVNTKILPTGAMYFHLNMWAPAGEWPSAYNSALKPVSSATLNSTYSMIVDYVKVDSIVNKTVSSDATLKGLSVSQGVLSFAPSQLSYTVDVTNAATSITVIPTLNSISSLLKINGNVATSGQTSATIPLSIGNNTITISVMAEDGTKKTYTVVVNRGLSSDADLSSLDLDIVASVPKFSPNDTVYTAGRIMYDQTSVRVYAVLHDPKATFKVNGKITSSGQLSDPILLNVGNNTITIVVTAVDGTTKTYRIIARRLNSDANLIDLTMSPGALSPAFSSDWTLYTGSIAKNVTSIVLTPTLSDPNAVVRVNGIIVPSGKPSNPIELSSGNNGISISVSSEDMMKSKHYSLSVMAANADARLISLNLNQGILNPSFVYDITSYTVAVPNTVTSIILNPQLNDQKAFMKINGVSAENAKPSNPISLNLGANTINIVVTAENQVVTKTYTILVTRSTSTAISEIDQSPVKIFPNPSRGMVYLETNDINRSDNVVVSNFVGQYLFQKKITDNITTLDLSNYSAGIYFLKVSNKINKILIMR